MKSALLLMMNLLISSSSFAMTTYFCAVNPKFPNKVAVFRGQMSEQILLESVTPMPISKLKKIKVTSEDDHDDNDQISCLMPIGGVFVDFGQKAQFRVYPVRHIYAGCGDGADVTIPFWDLERTDFDLMILGQGKLSGQTEFDYNGSELFFCGASQAD